MVSRRSLWTPALAGALFFTPHIAQALSNQTSGPGARPPAAVGSEEQVSEPQASHSSTRAPASASGAETSSSTALPAIAVFIPSKTSQVRGTVQFVPEGGNLKVLANVEGLEPKSKHGLHIHEFGDCSDPAFKNAGGHYNPTGEPHGAPGKAKHHLGDLGNIVADANGKATYEITVPGTQTKDAGIIGRAVVIHQKPDDLKSQPAGDSGDRIACGVIGLTKR